MLVTSPVTYARSLQFRKAILFLNGGFLVVMGGLFGVLDLVGYYTGGGPLGGILQGEFLTVGILEAHGLAFILGLLLVRAAAADPKPFWHLTGAGIQLLLGASNLLFWPAFVAWGIVSGEIVVTGIHGLLLIAQLVCFVLAGKE